MDRKKYLISLLLLFLVLMLSSFSCAFAATGEDIAKPFLHDAEMCKELLAKLRGNATITISITLLIAALGFIIGVMRLNSSKLCKYCVIVLGLLVTLFTAANEKIFQVGYSEYNRNIGIIDNAIYNIESKCALLKDTDDVDDQKELRDDLERTVDIVLDIRQRRLHDVYILEVLKNSIFRVSQVFAAGDPRPSWVTTLPSDEMNLYFIGKGKSEKYTIAKESAKKDAIEQAQHHYQNLFNADYRWVDSNFDFDQFAGYLSASGTIHKEYVFKDKENNEVQFYVLLRINRRYSVVDMELFARKNELKVPPKIITAVENDDGHNIEYNAKRMEQRNKNIEYALSELGYSKQLRDAFDKGNTFRHSSRYESSVEQYDIVIDASPEFYLPYINELNNSNIITYAK